LNAGKEKNTIKKSEVGKTPKAEQKKKTGIAAQAWHVIKWYKVASSLPLQKA
jgi:hypothetical protein